MAQAQFTRQVIELARVIDALPVLEALVVLYQAERAESIEFLALRQQLTDRVLLALFETSSTVAELICERDRADQSADRMDAIDTSRIKRLTLASVVVGGVAAVVSGGLGLAGAASTASDAMEVAGGTFSTGFGGTALFIQSQQEFRHDRNLLMEIWKDPAESALFSPSTWRFLHRRHRERDRTPRDELVEAWRQEGRLGEPGSSEEAKREALFFGPGGVYTAAELRARASMIETLEATVRLINEELELFIREITTTFVRSPPP